MPLSFGPTIVEGKVYRGRRKQDGDEEKQALKEIQTILSYKNRRPCDCEAQVHDLLENCLGCGRLACVEEGPGKCFFCGNIVLTREQRNKLRNYIDIPQLTTFNEASRSQPSGSKIKIIDNQFDHFTIENKKHLRGRDRTELKKNLDELQARRYQRKLMLDIDLDNLEAGAQSVPEVDYEADLKKLQLNSQSVLIQSTATLAELVTREFKARKSLVYTIDSSKSVPNSHKSNQTAIKNNAESRSRTKSSDQFNDKPKVKPQRKYKYSSKESQSRGAGKSSENQQTR